MLVHAPDGAALVTLATIACDRPAASVPERWLNAIHESCTAALHAIGTVPVLRSRIVTLCGSASRWLTLTMKLAALAPCLEEEAPPAPAPAPAEALTVPLMPVAPPPCGGA